MCLFACAYACSHIQAFAISFVFFLLILFLGKETPVHPLAATPIGPGSKPGTVKAIVSQRYNNPIGLYSNENVNTQLQGQSKFLIESDDVAR